MKMRPSISWKGDLLYGRRHGGCVLFNMLLACLNHCYAVVSWRDLYPVTKPLTIPTALLSTSSSTWHQRLGLPGYATRVGFYHTCCDSSLFILRQGSQQVITFLHNEFDMTNLEALNYFLGISASRHSTRLFLSQKQYAIELLAHAHMIDYNPSRTSVDTNSKLVRQICLYMHDPREPHHDVLKRILRYIQGTLDFGFHLYSSTTISLVGYTDADWAGCPSTRRAEAEYQGVTNVIAETAWLHNLLRELHSPLSAATLVYYHNVSATYVSANPIQHLRDLVTAGQV
nr:hypothetical protein [Tanacetum cinerariifolium]